MDYSSAEREHLRYQFRQIIIGSELRALGYAVAVADWDELIQGEARDWFGSAEDIAFGGCIRGAMEATHIMSEEVLALHFDAGRKGSVLALANRALKRHSGPVLLQSIQFSQVGQETALQAADMLAWETFQFAKDHRLGNQANPHFQNLLENIVAQGFMLDRKSILATLEDFRLNVAIEG